MSRATRVRKRAEFERIQNGGARVTTRSFVLIVAGRLDDGPTRLGITASRRIGGAVTRSRAKRLVREAFRAHPELFSPGIDLVVIVRKPPGEMKAHEVAAEWLGASQQLARRMREALAACRTPGRGQDVPKAP